MKTHQLYSVTIIFLLSSVSFVTQAMLNVKKDKQADALSMRYDFDMISFFSRPVQFTSEGLSDYFQHVFNNSAYSKYLPHSMFHMIQFLQYGTQSSQDHAYAASVLKMFTQKVKAVSYIEAEAFAEFLPMFLDAIKPYFCKAQPPSVLKDLQKSVQDKLNYIFSRYFNQFQKDPEAFMVSLSEQIVQHSAAELQKNTVTPELLQKDVQRFVELCLQKIIWSSQDDVSIWHVCNRLAQECHDVCLQGVLCGTDAFDDVCWSIIHRFCYFVELSKTSLSKNFYSQILHDLQTKPLILCSVGEQEELMTDKKTFLICKMQECKQFCCDQGVCTVQDVATLA